ncbi:hypothetical protein TSUD_34180 [Trifolium subterraneum]|uniref:Reverse transcriptase zinc-binding domain-containing protein n=1 Tax=Trifolium subterraneum TaxID=3900 RepID=A0A2Z6NVG2_TRISU|nr:hypothetical protein TSUD_34180 [Trifolium subterraneum]
MIQIYGHLPTQLLGEVSSPVGAKFSLWWKDIIARVGGIEADCFNSNVHPCVGNGVNIGFWKSNWFRNQSFSDLYPDIYVKEARQNASVADRLGDFGESSVISWQWTEQLSVSEEQQATELSMLLIGFSLQPGKHDYWRWRPESSGLFSVKSCYNILLNTRQITSLDSNVLHAINQLWRNDISSKVLVFSWRWLLDMLPTRVALNHRVCGEEVFHWFNKKYHPGAEGWYHYNLFGDMGRHSECLLPCEGHQNYFLDLV